MIRTVIKGLGAVAVIAFTMSTVSSTAQAHIFRHGGGSGGSWGSSSSSSSGGWGSSSSSSSGGSWGSSGGYHHHHHAYYGSWGSSSSSSSGGSWGSSSSSSSGGSWGTYHHVAPPAVAPEGDHGPATPPAPGDQPKEARNATGSALVSVTVPADAIVFINGYQTKTAGENRQYISRGLVAGEMYNYEVRAEITRDGKAVTETKTVQLTAGGSKDLAFNLSEDNGSRIAKTEVKKSGR